MGSLGNLAVLNTRDVKRIHQQLDEQYGFGGKLDLVFLLHEKKEKLFIMTQDIGDIGLEDLRVDSLGLYFAAWFDGQLRLSIEATQLIGPGCTKNVIDLSKEEMQQWMLGKSIERNIQTRGFVIMRHGDDFLGCGKAVEGKIINYIPKSRYVHALY